MTFKTTLKLATFASLAVLTLAACSDTSISSPGVAEFPTSPPPPPPPPPPPSATIDLVPAAGCPVGTNELALDAVAADGLSDTAVCAIGAASGTTTLTTDLTIPANSTIAIQGPVFVGEDTTTPVTLTVGAGVRFFGAATNGSAGGSDDYIVVTRGSALEAIGTEAAPIRFTARAAINDEETGSANITATSSGLWGGLVINGAAPINACEDGTATGGTAACEKSGEGSSGLFGGDNPSDDSGELRYVIVEYAGARLTNTDELNGIAFQGVGRGTEVNYIQVHNNLDDGIEMFGGTVEMKYVAITGAGDDSIDWTDGWQGKLQFAAVRSTLPTSDDPRGIEADSLSSNPSATPFSNPDISNFTLVGTDSNQQGILLRRGTGGRILNGVVTGYATGLDVDTAETFTNFDNGDLVIESHFFDVAEPLATDSDGVPVIPASANVVTGNNTLTDGFFPGQQESAVPASTALAGDAFFDAVDYVGAFGADESVEASWANFTRPGTLFDDTSTPAECPTGTAENGTLDGKAVCQIDGSAAITADLTLTDGDQLVYELVGPVFIGTDQGADPDNPATNVAPVTLTIEAGVTVVAEGNDDYLVIPRGNQILSNGTEADPVVFTAKGALDGTISVGDDTKGIWGGLIINGRAPINACEDGTATGGTIACEKSGEGSSGLFGGASADDDSGQLFYTRVQYAGTRLTNTDELNGIAFQGTGSGLEVEYVQVYNNLDDCFEWFGGATNAKYLVALGCGDDSLDWTDGWQGSLQYAIVYSGVAGADGGLSDDPRGIEGDNLSSDPTATPLSAPRVSNFSIISGGDAGSDTGIVLRRGMAGTIANGVVIGWPDAGLDVDTQATLDNVADGSLQVASIFLSGNGDDLENDGDNPTFPADANLVAGQTVTTTGFAFRAGRPGLVPGANEQAVPALDVTGVGALEATTYVGAVEDATDEWFLGWTVDQTGTQTAKSN